MLAITTAVAPPASAQDATPDFDFYVLSLSWSPSYCEAAGSRADKQQCAASRPYSFVVHGLWPQRERGYPENCDKERRNLPRKIVESMLDLMPSRRLVYHEWDAHGSCSGLDQQAYFDKIRAARQAITIPTAYQSLDKDLSTSPDAVEKAFVDANPGLKPDMIAVTCRRRLLEEVQVCMDKDLKFRACPEVDRKACRSETVVMPPERGGS